MADKELIERELAEWEEAERALRVELAHRIADEWRFDEWRTKRGKIDEWAGDDPVAQPIAERAKRQIRSDAQYFGLQKMASRLDNLGKTCAMVVRVFQGGYGPAGIEFYEAADILGVDSPELGLADVSAAWELFSLALSNASERLEREAKRTHFPGAGSETTTTEAIAN